MENQIEKKMENEMEKLGLCRGYLGSISFGEFIVLNIE